MEAAVVCGRDRDTENGDSHNAGKKEKRKVKQSAQWQGQTNSQHPVGLTRSPL